LSDFLKGFQTVEEFVRNSTKGFLQNLDHMSFKATVNMLKSDDAESVRIAIEQLAKEKNPLSIPPLYVVAKAHPSSFLKEKAQTALNIIDPQHEAEKLAGDKPYKEAVFALVQHYGNYRAK
jgi:hypothetical protein